MEQYLGRHVRHARGQSTLEYILVLAAVLLALIFAAGTFIQPGVQGTVQQAGTAITNAGNQVLSGVGL